MKDDTLLYVIGGVGLLWLMSRMAPASVAAQNAALQQSAALQSQAINTNANISYANTAANLANQLATDFSGNS